MARTKFNPLQLLLNTFVNTYTNTGSGGGTGYYINLGGIKLCWGSDGGFSTTSGSTYTFSLPTGFFTTIQSVNTNVFGASAVPSYTGQAFTTSLVTYFFGSTLTNVHFHWFVIGT